MSGARPRPERHKAWRSRYAPDQRLISTLQQRQQLRLHMGIVKIFQDAIVGLNIFDRGKEEAAQETNLRDTATEVAKPIPMSNGTAR